MSRGVLLSIKPTYLESIVSGAKTDELRRCAPRITEGDRVFMYASSPRRVLLAEARVDRVICLKPTPLWMEVRETCGISRAEFRRYFAGASLGSAIRLQRVVLLPEIPLAEMREISGELEPPQNFRYLCARVMGYLDEVTRTRGRVEG